VYILPAATVAPFYYLHNFQHVLAWLEQRYSDMLNAHELAFIRQFEKLPQPSQALLVRMVMRKGCHFRLSKLHYEEIGSTHTAVAPLLSAGWVTDAPMLEMEQLFALLSKQELQQFFPEQIGHIPRKADMLAILKAEFAQARDLADWLPGFSEAVYALQCMDICDRLRLMYFGNLHQDWSEFILADLGIYQYEQVPFLPDSRAFQQREEVDAYLHLQACRERFEAGDAFDQVLSEVPAQPYSNPWLEARRGKLLFQMARFCESEQDFSQALQLYRQSNHPQARYRAIRVLERSGNFAEACTQAEQAMQQLISETEQQSLQRMLPRLQRRLNLSATVSQKKVHATDRIDLTLPQPKPYYGVELAVCDDLLQHTDTYYVENGLVNSLFGLLCWDAVFAAVPGAFFHPFQTGPADLFDADFLPRRSELFAGCLDQLKTGAYKSSIWHAFEQKQGLQSPFVYWDLLSEKLLQQALSCLPADHLHAWFYRMLHDMKNNRTGWPDLIQFWPQDQRYRMVEVKGPGDRLQDNQLRWLSFFQQHGMPAAVCYVRWQEHG